MQFPLSSAKQFLTFPSGSGGDCLGNVSLGRAPTKLPSSQPPNRPAILRRLISSSQNAAGRTDLHEDTRGSATCHSQRSKGGGAMGRREFPSTPLRPKLPCFPSWETGVLVCVQRIQKQALLWSLQIGATRPPHPRPGTVRANMFWRKQMPRAGDADTPTGRDSRNNACS